MANLKSKLFTMASRRNQGGMPSGIARKDVKKRWMIIGGGSLVAMVVGMTYFGEPIQAPEKKPQARRFNTTPIDAGKRSFEASTQKDIESLKSSFASLADTNQRLLDQLEQMRRDNANRDAQPSKAPVKVESPGKALFDNPWGPPKMPDSLITDGNKNALPDAKQPIMPPKPPAEPKPIPSNAELRPQTEGGNPAPSDTGPVSYRPDSSNTVGGVAPGSAMVTRSLQRNQSAGTLVPSFVPVALLHGLDAEGGSNGQANPQPVFLRIQDNSILPGSARYQLKSCFLLGAGWANMSMQRALFRLANITCVDKNDRLVLDQPIKGYLVDSDSTLGFRGEVADRQGAKLWRATLASFAQGLGTAMNPGAGMGTSLVSTRPTVSEAFNSSALSGASTAANQVAQFYLQEAQSIFPVIAVEPGKTGTAVFTEKVQLKWLRADGMYAEELTPVGTKKGN